MTDAPADTLPCDPLPPDPLPPGARVLIVARNLKLGAGGMERTAVNLANHLHRRGLSVTVAYRDTDQDAPIYQIADGVRHLVGSFDPGWLAGVATALDPWAIVFFYATWHEARAATALSDTGLPVVLHEGTNPARAINANWAAVRDIPAQQAAQERLSLMSLCTRMRFTLPDYRASLPGPLRRDARAFPNAFAPANPADIALRGAEARRIFLNIGGLKRVKNGVAVVQAFGLIADRIPDWDLRIFSAQPGSSDTRHKIDALAASHGLQSRIQIFPPTPEIAREYGRAQVHIITSKEEGLPNCVAEAARHALPSIGFACCPGTNSLIVHGRNGLLAQCGEGEIEDLAAQMLRLAQNDAEREAFGQAALEDSRIFDPDEIFRQWEEIIAEAAADRPGRAALLERHQPDPAARRRIRAIQRSTLLSRPLAAARPAAGGVSVIVALEDHGKAPDAGLASLRDAGADEVILVGAGTGIAGHDDWRMLPERADTLAGALNAGLAQARHDAVHFCVPGMVYRPGALREAAQHMARQQLDIAAAGHTGSEVTHLALSPGLLDAAPLAQNLYDRHFLRAHDLSFPNHPLAPEDFELRAFAEAERIGGIAATLGDMGAAPAREIGADAMEGLARRSRDYYAAHGHSGLEPERQSYLIARIIAPALHDAVMARDPAARFDHALLTRLRLLISEMPEGLRAAPGDPRLHLALLALRQGYLIWLADLLNGQRPREFAPWMLAAEPRDRPLIRALTAQAL
ncbi:MAG: glycosyltransferase [Paracoccus sp. (in: a-proteobacteria)]|nr:glycosyltransferase [Paracoccus sp. (in: a-proteobacteria)]